MKRSAIFFVLFAIWSTTNAVDLDLVQSRSLTCEFLDSVNITDGILLPNKSISFDGTVFPEEYYTKSNLTLRGRRLFIVDPYVRGCLCQLRSCIRLCCPKGENLDFHSENSGKCQPSNVTGKLEGPILDSNDEIQHVNFEQQFGIIHSFPCNQVLIPGGQFHIRYVY